VHLAQKRGVQKELGSEVRGTLTLIKQARWATAAMIYSWWKQEFPGNGFIKSQIFGDVDGLVGNFQQWEFSGPLGSNRS
jgi:hypothetical protein